MVTAAKLTPVIRSGRVGIVTQKRSDFCGTMAVFGVLGWFLGIVPQK
jgi:hypothetical protein